MIRLFAVLALILSAADPSADPQAAVAAEAGPVTVGVEAGVGQAKPADTTGFKLTAVKLGPDQANDYILVQTLQASPDSGSVTCLHRYGNDLGFDGVALNGQNHLGVLYSTQPVFSPDSRTLGFLIREGSARWKLIDDRQAYTAFEPASTVRFSPDGNRLIYLARDDAKRFIVEFDQPQRKFDDVDWDHLVFTPDSSLLAYRARQGGHWYMVVNGEIGPAWERIVTSPVVAPHSQCVYFVAYRQGRYFVVDRHEDVTAAGPDRAGEEAGHCLIDRPPVVSDDGKTVVYWALDDDQRWHLYRNGQRMPGVDADRPGQVVLSADGQSLAAVLKQGGGWRVLVNGEMSPGYAAIGAGSLSMSPDGKRIAYAVRQPTGWAVVLDGKAQPTYSQLAADGMRFSPDGRRFVYTALDQGRWVVIEGEVHQPAFSRIDTHSLTFSPDSKHITYLASRYDRPTIVLDGQALGEYDAVMLPTFSPGSKHLVYLTRQADVYRLCVDGEPTDATFAERIPGAAIHFVDDTHCQTVALRRPAPSRPIGAMTFGIMPKHIQTGPTLWRFKLDLTPELPPDYNGTPAPAPGSEPDADPNALDPSFVDVPTD